MKNTIKKFIGILYTHKLKILEPNNSHPVIYSEIINDKIINDLTLFNCYYIGNNLFSLPSYLYYGIKKLKEKPLEEF